MNAEIAALVALVVALLWHSPIFKPWFGFRRPKGHQGRWFQ
jgi:hypothetical protein